MIKDASRETRGDTSRWREKCSVESSPAAQKLEYKRGRGVIRYLKKGNPRVSKTRHPSEAGKRKLNWLDFDSNAKPWLISSPEKTRGDRKKESFQFQCVGSFGGGREDNNLREGGTERGTAEIGPGEE